MRSTSPFVSTKIIHLRELSRPHKCLRLCNCGNIRSLAQTFGSVKLFKTYLEVTEQVPVSRALQSSGVSLTDCPHNGRKDVSAPSTIVLISGNRDFALSILRLRLYRVVLITLSNAYPSLKAQASLCFDWVFDVLEPLDSTLVHQPMSPYR